MTGSKVLLDTNIISALIGGEKKIAQHIDKIRNVYIQVIVLGELFYGVHNSKRANQNLNIVKKVGDRYKLLHIDESISFEYGKVKSSLKRQGTPIPENDIWIAATAIRHKLLLATRDNHFNVVKGLKIISW